jgi:hypothetical protein
MSGPTADDALLSLAFSIQSNPGAYALLVGAGVSASSGLPTAWNVLEDLTARLADLSDDKSEDPITWFEETYGEQPQYETLLERLAPTQVERQRLLHGYFEPTAEDLESGRKAPTLAHRSIARMVRAGTIRVILTLNFDRLIEQALRAEGIEPTVIATPSDIEGMAPLHTISCCVIHLHGDYLNPTSMRNTASELESYRPMTLTLLQRVLEDYGLIIAGWSSTYDPVLREAIARHYPARLTLAWIEPHAESTQATELRSLKKGLLISSDADDAFGRLADAVEALGVRRAHHPLTVPAAVETAKRELSGRTVAIGLHDRLNREFGSLHEHPDFHLPDLHDDRGYGGYEAILSRIEESSRLACALTATLAYWGNSNTDRWWIDELSRFAVRRRGGGLTRLIALRQVAGTALFYSAGVAAVAARRYNLLAQLFNVSAQDPHDGGRDTGARVLIPASVYEARNGSARFYSLVSPLLREALSLNDEALDDAWQQFEVLRLAVLTIQNRDFGVRHGEFLGAAFSQSAAQDAFDQTERNREDTALVRQRLAEATRERSRQLGQLADLAPVRAAHLMAMSVFGEYAAYRSPVAERLVEELDAEGEIHPLVKAGIASHEALAAALTAVSVAVGRWVLTTNMASRAQPNSGVTFLADEVWLDSGKTPAELRRQ